MGAAYALHTCGAGPVFVGLHALAYFFDTADGQLARTYCTTSRFGDLYDHTTDVLAFAALVGVVWLRYRPSLTVATVFVLCGFLNLVHLGCQQRWYNHRRPPDGGGDGQEEETLDVFQRMCPGTHWMPATRLFGSGTLQVIMVITVLWLEHRQTSKVGQAFAFT